MTKSWKLWLVRSPFILLAIYEALEALHILHQQTNFTWVGILITDLGVFTFLEIMQWRFRRRGASLPIWIWLLGFASVAYDAGGDIFFGYSDFSWYDQVAHLFGGFTATMLIGTIVRYGERANFFKLNSTLRWAFPLTFTIAAGLLYELEEYSEDWLACLHRGLMPIWLANIMVCGKRWGGLEDTINDLWLNFFGALIALVVLWLLRRRDQSPDPARAKAPAIA